MAKYVYLFSEGNASMKNLLGGKGANLAEMTNLGMPVPQGFTVTTEAVNCHHNYVAREHHYGADVWVTRKGAIRAGQGELGIVPGSMGARSYIVRGKGNAESFCSSAHGAGRRMSRTAATKRFTEADLERDAEVAERTGSSEGSVVGLCQLLGARGFQEVKIALARDLVQPVQFIHEDLTQETVGASLHLEGLTQLLLSDVALLHQAFSQATIGCWPEEPLNDRCVCSHHLRHLSFAWSPPRRGGIDPLARIRRPMPPDPSRASPAYAAGVSDRVRRAPIRCVCRKEYRGASSRRVGGPADCRNSRSGKWGCAKGMPFPARGWIYRGLLRTPSWEGVACQEPEEGGQRNACR